MTRPRIVDPGATLALSRRTTRRHFLPHPDEARQIEQIYWYCLAHAAKLHGVLVHALLTPDAIVESIAYLITNPVAAGAVRYAKDWPGAQTLPAHVGTRVIRVKRPKHYFDPENPEWPEELELRLEMPVVLQLNYGSELARERIADRVRAKQHRAWNEAKRSGRSCVGPRRVLKLAHTKRAKSYEVFGSLNPQFAAAGHRGTASQAIKRLRTFKAQYARALAAWNGFSRCGL